MASHAQLVGIVNVTPDSFSDGGCYFDRNAALAHIRQLIEDGANIIDIGAESTRPGAVPLNAEDEWERLEAILDEAIGMAKRSGVVVSIDTRHGLTAKKALDKGVDWINDVSGCDDPEMVEVLRTSDCPIVIMHHLGIPARKDVTLEEGTDVVETIMRWGENKISELEMRGIKRSRVILDPGVGFGKTPQQSLVIIQNAHTFKSLGIPVYIGHSRKSFIRLLADDYEKEKDRLTLELSLEMSANGIDYLRVHDVKAHAEMFLESE